jgi:2-iminoacetate synthase
MSFLAAFNERGWEELRTASARATADSVTKSLAKSAPTLADFAQFISPAAAEFLEVMGQRSRALTRQRFGRVVRLFAPLYLSNECINHCEYCGFSRDNPILRVTLSVPEVVREASALQATGFRNLLLVAGEHPKFVSSGYLAECVKAVRPLFPSVALEVGPLGTADYRSLVQAGAEGLVVYQETYEREMYAQMHTAGPKKDFDWRLETAERAYAGGFRRLGIGALLGLTDWRTEAMKLAAHAEYLLRHCWRAQLTVSLPRLRPCAGEFKPLVSVSDRDLAQFMIALRLLLPDVGIVLSTRESPRLRDGLMPLGVTMMSAGSHTEPGGYTGAGKQNVHRTERGRIVAPVVGASEWADAPQPATAATGQFEIADHRSVAEVAQVIRNLGYEPVWKDWDAAFTE